jgi:hypothetical protein
MLFQYAAIPTVVIMRTFVYLIQNSVFFYCCTVHFDNTEMLITIKCTLYYTYKMLKYTVKISHDCSYMFRSTWTIIS